jgi:peptidoglycan hydrolase-like protein with peptidoglycan-binding domain
MYASLGSCGRIVEAIQHALNAQGGGDWLDPDGIFGPLTGARVHQHQSFCNLSPDGLVGRLTMDSLFQMVELSGRANFKRKNASAAAPVRRSFAFGAGESAGVLGPTWLNPELAEYARHVEAFQRWWNQGAPKQPLPVPPPLVFPKPPIWIPLPPLTPPNAFTLKVPEGKAVSAGFANSIFGSEYKLTLEGSSDLKKDPQEPKKGYHFEQAEWTFKLEYPIFKYRNLEVSFAPALIKDGSGEFHVEASAELEFKNDLIPKIGKKTAFELIPFLGVAAKTNLEVEAEAGIKAALEIDVTSLGTKITVGVKGGPKAAFGSVKRPDGREEQQWTGIPFSAGGFLEAQFE